MHPKSLITICHLAYDINLSKNPLFAPGLSVCPLSSHLPHHVVFKEKAAWESGDLCVKLPNNNVSPSEWEHPVHGKVRIILNCLICMQNMTYEAAGC